MKELLPGSFIYEVRDALTPEQCFGIVDAFERYPEGQHPGVIANGQVNVDLKRSTDFKLSIHPECANLDNILVGSTRQILHDYPHRDWIVGTLNDSGYQVQRTMEGEFYGRHFDTDGLGAVALRQLVIIWYLNTPIRGGHTKFFNQKIRVKPETGKAIVFPAFWTHPHEGQVVRAGCKYIATTWITL